jgi:hypothetical protein
MQESRSFAPPACELRRRFETAEQNHFLIEPKEARHVERRGRRLILQPHIRPTLHFLSRDRGRLFFAGSNPVSNYYNSMFGRVVSVQSNMGDECGSIWPDM